MNRPISTNEALLGTKVVESLEKLYSEGIVYMGARVQCILSEIRGDWEMLQVSMHLHIV